MEEPQIRNSTSQEDMLEKDEMPSDSDLKNQYNEPSLEREDDDSEVPENTEPKISQKSEEENENEQKEAEENEENEENDQKEEREENSEEKSDERNNNVNKVNANNQDNSEIVLNKENIANNYADDGQVHEEYRYSLSGKLYKLIKATEGYTEYEEVKIDQPYNVSSTNQDYQYYGGNQNYQYNQQGQEYQYDLPSQSYQDGQYYPYYQQGQIYPSYQNNVQNYQYSYGGQENQYINIEQPYQYQQNLGYQIQVPGSKTYQHKYQRQNVIEIISSPKKPDNNNMAQFRKGIHQIKKTNKDEKKVKRNQSPKDSVSKKVKSRNEESSIPDSKSQGIGFNKQNPKLFSFKDISSKRIDSFSYVNLDKKEFSENMDIPKESNEKHLKAKTLYLDAMNSGKYRFKEKEEPENTKISQKEILNEISRRSALETKKKDNFEILDKYVSYTFIDKKGLKGKIGKINEKVRTDSMNETNTNNDFKNSKTQSQSLSPISLSSNIKTKSKIETGNNSNSNSSPNNNNEISSIKFNSELSLEPNDNYSKYIFDQINKIRTDPQSFIGIIDDSKANIVKNKNGLFAYDGKVKIALFEGESAFDEAIEDLQNTEPMGKLEFCPLITAQLPRNEKEIKDKNYLKTQVKEMIDGGINVKCYWRDLIKDPETSFLLTIVDDNGSRKGRKRRDILNPKMKYIGISSVQISNKFACYVTLSSKLEK